MATVSVPVLKPLTYQGRSYVRGDHVTCEPLQAALMAKRGEVSLTRGVTITRALEAAPSPEPTVRTRRQYRRRDMTAEPVGE